MNHYGIFGLSFFTIVSLKAILFTQARESYQTEIPNGADVRDGDGNPWPGVGHFSSTGGGVRNPFGVDFDLEGRTWTKALCEKDSDGDGLTNGEELGDPECVWTRGDIPQFSIVTHPGFADDVRAEVTIDSCENFTVPSNSVEINVTFPNYSVPTVETTYAKYAVNLTSLKEEQGLSLDRDILISRFTPLIVEEQVVHHILLYGCEMSQVIGYTEEPNPSGGMPCTDFLYAWAVGGKSFCLPEGVKVPISKDTAFLMLEIHYDNPRTSSGYTDSSGIGMTAVEKPSNITGIEEAGFILLGAPVDGPISIPPGLDYYEVTASCNAPSNFPEVDVFASILHGHQIARKIFLVLDKYETGERDITACKPYYDFDLQEFIPNAPYKLKSNDKLTIHCIYDSTERTQTTIGGDATEDEMCLVILFYYPKLTVQATCLQEAVVKQGPQVQDPTVICSSSLQTILPSTSPPSWYFTHGITMLVAWFLVFPFGVITVMTQKHKGGSIWFQIHRAVMVFGDILVLGAALIAISNVSIHLTTTHTKVGIAAVTLALFQPISGVLRPKTVPVTEVKSTIRFLWELQHQWTGRIALGLSVYAVYTGLENLKPYGNKAAIEAVSIAFVALFCFAAILSIFYVLFFRKDEKNDGIWSKRS